MSQKLVRLIELLFTEGSKEQELRQKGWVVEHDTSEYAFLYSSDSWIQVKNKKRNKDWRADPVMGYRSIIKPNFILMNNITTRK